MADWREWPIVIESRLMKERIIRNKKKIIIISACSVLIIVLLIIFGKITYQKIYDYKIKQILGNTFPQSENMINNKVYICENDPNVQSMGYVYIHGYKEHDIHAFDYERGLLANDSKTKGILDFDYNESLSTYAICRIFLQEFNTFVSENDFDEIIILARSAGGNIISYCAPDLKFDGTIEIHTLAAPLNGYQVDDKYLTNRYGIERELGRGYPPYGKPPSNVKIYHHKTVDDESLRSWCGIYDYLCDPIKIQDNDVIGSKEFWYPGLNHSSIVQVVSKMVIDCHSG
jgi:hypothetical protein